MARSIIITLILINCLCTLHGQDSLINKLLTELREEQQHNGQHFLPGIFPSYISNAPFYNEQKRDNNIFFNGLISYTLLSLKNILSDRDKILIEEINSETQQASLHFKNQKGRPTYNFWRTDTAFNFPYTWWIGKIKKDAALPDDMDDTVLALLANNASTATADSVHELMQLYINNGNELKTTFRRYRKYNTYSTWFGKNFPVVFDVSVLCNVLSFVQHYDLKWTGADSSALHMILLSIKNGDIIKHPAIISPYYAKPSIILYHITRLMEVKQIKELEEIKPLIIKHTKDQLKTSGDLLEKVILSSALIKLGEQGLVIPTHEWDLIKEKTEQSDLCFFTGNIPSYFSQPYKQLLTNKNVLMFYHYCSAYNKALLIEYLALTKKMNEKCL